MNDATYADILNRAMDAAYAATKKYIEDNPGQWYPCGFAWVKIRPARGKFVNFLKAHSIGKTDTYEGGYTIWNPSGNNTQSMDAKYAGARAFADVLKDAGIKCTPYSRID